MSVTEPRWLDRLSRRAAPRERGYAPVRVVDSGLSRRTVMRATGAAVVLGGAVRFLGRPPVARADALSDCIDYARKTDDYLYNKCTAGPSSAYQRYDSAVQHALAGLRTAKTSAQKARLDQILQRARTGRQQATNALMDCGFESAHRRARDEQDCKIKNPPAGGGGAGSGGGGGGGGGSGGGGSICPEGTNLCTKVDNVTTCCYGSDTCCACQGGLCCIYPDCRCCPS